MNQELLDKIALIKEEMREIIDNAEVQERSLTDDEKYQFEYKELEIRELEAQIQNTIEKKRLIISMFPRKYSSRCFL